MSITPTAIASAPDWSQPVEVAGSGAGSSVGIDGRGTITAAWFTQEPQAFVATREAGSESFQPPLNLGGAGAVAPELAVNEAGAAVVAWIERATRCEGLSFLDCPHRLGIRVRARAGTEFGPARYVAEDATETPAVAINQAGEAVVAWPGQGGTIAAVLGSARDGFAAPMQLRPATGQGFSPRRVAAIGEDGTALVSWMSFGGPVMASYRPSGGAFGAPEEVSPVDPSNGLAAVVNAHGTATVAFMSNADAALVLSTRDPGRRFRPGRSLGASAVSEVALDQDAGDNQLVYWTEQTGPRENGPPRPTHQSHASFRDAGEDWGDPLSILPPNSFPTLNLDRMGNAHALWTTNQSHGGRIMGATLTRFGILERPQLLTEFSGQVSDMEANRAGAAVGIFTEVLDSSTATVQTAVRVVSRLADERAARVRMAASVSTTAVRIRARCDEPCRLRARLGGQRKAAAARGPAVLTLRARRRGSLRIALARRTRARLLGGRRVTLVVRAADGAGNMRTIRRRLCL